MAQPKNLIRQWLKKLYEPITVVTFLLFVSTVFLYCATRDLVDEAKNTAERQLRAYLSVNATPGVKQNGTRLQFFIENYGQTPAKKVRVTSNLEIRNKDEPLQSDFDFAEHPVCGIPQPKYPNLGAVAPRNPTLKSHEICPEQMGDYALAERGEKIAYLYGRIEYLDIFDEPRETTYCWIIGRVPGTAQVCDRHDEIDPKDNQAARSSAK